MKNRIYLQGFEDGYPFVPTSKEVIYMPFAGSAILDSFFERNLEWVKALFKEHLHYEFIFIPDVVKSYIVHQVNHTYNYFHPLAEAPSAETMHNVEQHLLNSLLHNDDANALAPGLIHFMQTELFREIEGEHEGCFEFSYYPLEEDSDESIMTTLRLYVENCGESYGHLNYGLPYIGEYCEADIAFYTAQEKYFEKFKDKDVNGISRYVIDSLAGPQPLSRIHITEDAEILLPDYNLKIVLPPVLKAIYLIFLKHPEGILFRNLADYTEELSAICLKIGITHDNDLSFIAHCLNPELDIIDQACGEIYSRFREKLDRKAAAPYIIQASPYDFEIEDGKPYLDIGEPKKILLDRFLVSYDIDFSA